MKPIARFLAALVVLAAAACGDATGPAHAALVGDWTTAPHEAESAEGRPLGIRQHTLRIDARGGFAWEDATLGPGGEIVSYARTLGRVEVEEGTVRFHPSGAMRWDEPATADDLHLAPGRAYGWRIAGDRLLVREPGGDGSVAFVRLPRGA